MVKTIRVLHLIDHFGFGGAQRILEGLNTYKSNKLYFYALRNSGSKQIRSKYKNVYCVNSRIKYNLPLFEIKHLSPIDEVMKECLKDFEDNNLVDINTKLFLFIICFIISL